MTAAGPGGALTILTPEPVDRGLTGRRAAAGVTLLAGIAALGVTRRMEPGNRTFILGALVVAAIWSMGALFGVVPPRWAVPLTTAAYAAATVPSGIALLTAAAVLIGALTGALRSVTGVLTAPTLAHLTWSIGMFLLLPLVLTSGR